MDDITLKPNNEEDSCLSCVVCTNHAPNNTCPMFNEESEEVIKELLVANMKEKPVLVAIPNKIARRTTMLAKELKKRKELKNVSKQANS